MQLHQGDARSAERMHFDLKICPLLLSCVWELQHSSRFWVAYKVARKASMMVRKTTPQEAMMSYISFAFKKKGFHELANAIYLKLSRMVSCEDC